MFKIILAMAAMMCFANGAFAAVDSHNVDYKTADGKEMQGYVAFSDSAAPAKGTIIIVPDWMGVSPFYQDKANQLAGEGYTVFVADVYGKNIRPADQKEAGQLATAYKSDRPLLRSHIQAAYDYVRGLQQAEGKKIVVMGCIVSVERPHWNLRGTGQSWQEWSVSMAGYQTRHLKMPKI